ncbi:MAG: SPFH/Band 7/PHB domain protein [Candidatus Thiodiazotropha sp. (ex Myrtea spinifera)]|nr:SPFH/Band 7/PHB domain protein [Candidatus Thiodiazotropha sp. (ex Myrtea spinifera)]
MEITTVTLYIYYLPVLILFVFILLGIRIVRPTHRGLTERLGRYHRFAEPGFHWIIPIVDQMYKVNITEQMVDAEPRVIITNDNLNVTVDAQVYFKVNQNEDNVKNSQYNVDNVSHQMVSLARTTLRNIIGTLSLKSANSERNKINKELYDTLMYETNSWGVEIIRAELKQIEPPKDVQSTMNQVVKAENEKIAAIDFATAKETEADGQKRATIKHAEGVKTSRILHAEGEAEAIRLVNDAANEYFVGNAQLLKRLETLSNALEENTTIVVPSNSDLVNVIGDLAGVLPINKKSSEG